VGVLSVCGLGVWMIDICFVYTPSYLRSEEEGASFFFFFFFCVGEETMDWGD
jgi:hypothetical protein